MRRLLFLLVLLAVASPPVQAVSYYFCPDVPTDDPGGSGTTFLPWDVVRQRAGVYATVFSFPAYTPIDALHKLNRPGRWLLSVAHAVDLPPGSGVWFGPEDVVLFDGAAYNPYFDGSAARQIDTALFGMASRQSMLDEDMNCSPYLAFTHHSPTNTPPTSLCMSLAEWTQMRL